RKAAGYISLRSWVNDVMRGLLRPSLGPTAGALSLVTPIHQIASIFSGRGGDASTPEDAGECNPSPYYPVKSSASHAAHAPAEHRQLLPADPRPSSTKEKRGTVRHPRIVIAAIAIAAAATIGGISAAVATGSSTPSPAAATPPATGSTYGGQQPASLATVQTASATVQGRTETILV